MSFSVSDERHRPRVAGHLAQHGLRPAAQPGCGPAFLRMLVDVARFNRAARRLSARRPPIDDYTLGGPAQRGPLVSELRATGISCPLGSAIWSADPTTFTRYPAATFARFFDNHGLLSIGDQPQWRTVTGGAARYVEAILRPLGSRVAARHARSRRWSGAAEARSNCGTHYGDAGGLRPRHLRHPRRPGARACCRTPPPPSGRCSAPSGTSPIWPSSTPTSGCCHRQPRARASWNYHVPADPALGADGDLRPHPPPEPRHRARRCLLTLNRPDAVDPARVLETFEYDHPVFDTRRDAGPAPARRDQRSTTGPRSAAPTGATASTRTASARRLEVCQRFGVTL